MRNFDLSPFRRSTVGFDQLFDLLERGSTAQTNEGYPPFDIEHESDDSYRITLAVAGFKSDDIEITAQQNQLIVTGRRAENDDGHYIHRGIASRSFERRFALGDFVKVRSADLNDGLLTIQLVREIPEEMKPHKIRIGTSTATRIEAGRSSETPSDNENDGVSAAA